MLFQVCRAGPGGQNLVMGHLPKEWRYSMSARVKGNKSRTGSRSRCKTTKQPSGSPLSQRPSVALQLDIYIEAEPSVSPSAWTMKKHL